MANKVTKNKTANAGKYSYKYTDLAQIHDYLESIGEKYIQYVQRIEGDDYIFTRRKIDGEWVDLQGAKLIDATLQGVQNPAQEAGSAITYARRYSLLMAYGLATEDDDAQTFSKPKMNEGFEDKEKGLAFTPHPASPKQLSYIKGLYDEAEYPVILATYGVKTFEELTAAACDELIKARKGGAKK